MWMGGLSWRDKVIMLWGWRSLPWWVRQKAIVGRVLVLFHPTLYDLEIERTNTFILTHICYHLHEPISDVTSTVNNVSCCAVGSLIAEAEPLVGGRDLRGDRGRYAGCVVS